MLLAHKYYDYDSLKQILKSDKLGGKFINKESNYFEGFYDKYIYLSSISSLNNNLKYYKYSIFLNIDILKNKIFYTSQDWNPMIFNNNNEINKIKKYNKIKDIEKIHLILSDLYKNNKYPKKNNLNQISLYKELKNLHKYIYCITLSYNNKEIIEYLKNNYPNIKLFFIK